jgi:hypothetical protein
MREALPPLSHYLLDVQNNIFIMLSYYEVVPYTFLLRSNLVIIGPQMRYFVSKRVLYLVAKKRYSKQHSLLCCLENGRDERIVYVGS